MRRHRTATQQSEDPDLQVFTPAPRIAQQPVVLAQLSFLWCMDGTWLSTLFPSGHDMMNFVAFPVLSVYPHTTDVYLSNITLENCL